MITTRGLIIGLAIGAGLTYLVYRITQATWKIGDVLSVPTEQGNLTYTITGIDTFTQVYGLSLGIWPDVGLQQTFTFSELKNLNPVLVGHVDIP